MGREFLHRLRMAAGHLAALIGAPMAGLSTPLAMIVVMLRAFRGACIADFRAHAADVIDELRSPAHERDRDPARRSTIVIEPDAVRQVGHVRLVEARLRAMFALLRAFVTRINAGFVHLVTHGILVS